MLQLGVGPIFGKQILADAEPIAISRIRIGIFFEAGGNIADLVKVPCQFALELRRRLASATPQRAFDFLERIEIAALGLEVIIGNAVQIAEPDEGFRKAHSIIWVSGAFRIQS